MFQTNYKRMDFMPVIMSSELITEQTGYRSTKEIVEGMVLAGQRLSDYRHGILDNMDEEYDEEQEAASPYENDPVDLQSAVEQSVMRFKAENKGVNEKEEVKNEEEIPVQEKPSDDKPKS